MFKSTFQKLILLHFVILLIAGTANSSGFENNALGMKALGMGGAFTGIGSDASTVFYNPGAMSFLEFSQVALGGSFRMNNASYLSPYMGNSDMKNKLTTNFHAYGVGMLSEKAAVGISINTPFCLRTGWDDNWTGRYIVRETKIAATYVQPTFSYLLSKSFSIGAGPIIAFGKTYQTRAIPYASNSGDVGEELNGNSVGFGANIGLYLRPNDEFSIGLTYRSSVKMKVKEGDVLFSNVPPSLVNDFPSTTSFSTNYTLPSVVSLGIGVNITRELLVGADINYTTWKSFDSLEFKFKNNSQLDFGRGAFYTNTFAFRLGAEYAITNRLALRIGGAYDMSPVSDNNLSPENPDADKFVFSAGGSIKIGEHLKVDLAYMLENFKQREVNNPELNFAGNYKSINNVFGVTLNYEF